MIAMAFLNRSMPSMFFGAQLTLRRKRRLQPQKAAR